jgi:ABC-type transport system involved in multi-copper enzyme maturation permease subunit
MLPGPVFYTELLTTARRARYYWLRFLYCSILFLSIWGTYQSISWDPDAMSIGRIGSFASTIFTTIATVQMLAVIALAPALVAGTIADESQRKTLHYLLSSRLTSGEIVLGKLLARILHLAVFVALGAPIVSLLTLFGGVDPTTVQLTYLGSFTLLFFIAALSILISTYTARPSDAIIHAYVFLFAWFVTPVLARTLSSIYPPASYLDPYIAFLDSWANPLPIDALESVAPNPLDPFLFWRFALQIVYGTFFSVWATWRLRRVYRARQDSIGAATSRLKRLITRIRSFRFIKPRPCGDDPILWKELFFRRASVTSKILGTIILGPVIVFLVGFTIFKASEALFHGTDAAKGFQIGRLYLTNYIDYSIIFFYSLGGLATAVAAAGSFTSERERDTWISLAATPLEAKNVLRGKMLGAAWSARWIWLLIGLVLIQGMIAFSFSWISLLATLIEICIYIWFFVSLGTFLSLRSKTTVRATGLTIGFIIFINYGYLFIVSPFIQSPLPDDLILMGCGPWVISETLFAAIAIDYHSHRQSNTIASCFFSVIGYGVFAAILTASSLRAYDRACDRPRRSGNNQAENKRSSSRDLTRNPTRSSSKR